MPIGAKLTTSNLRLIWYTRWEARPILALSAREGIVEGEATCIRTHSTATVFLERIALNTMCLTNVTS